MNFQGTASVLLWLSRVGWNSSARLLVAFSHLLQLSSLTDPKTGIVQTHLSHPSISATPMKQEMLHWNQN